MKRLVLDHFRRWGLVLTVVALLEFSLGWSVAAKPDQPFEFWAFLLALWAGATLLSIDLRRGVFRPLAVLPLTARQISRGWWLGTVPIPAIALTVLLFLGAGAFYGLHPNTNFPLERLGMASLFTLVWLGISFTLAFSAMRGFGNSVKEFFSISVINVLTFLAFFGSMILCPGASKSVLKTAILLGIGSLLTIAGMIRAEQFDPGRARQLSGGRIEPPHFRRPGFGLTPLKLDPPPHVPGGYGGILFLITTGFVRAFSYVALMVALIGLLSLGIGTRQDFTMFAMMGSFMACCFVVFFGPVLGLQHLRLLRTLPVSASSLAAAMVALGTLPLFALGMLVAGITWAVLGTSAAIIALNSYALMLGAASLCVSIAVWRGGGVPVYVLQIVTVFGFFYLPMYLKTITHHSQIPLYLTGIFTAFCILLAFLFTRQALTRSSHSYRVISGIQASPFGGAAWGAGR